MQIHIEVVVTFLRMFGAHMNVLFTNDHIGPTPTPPPPPPGELYDCWPTIVNKFWAHSSISFPYLSLLDVHLIPTPLKYRCLSKISNRTGPTYPKGHSIISFTHLVRISLVESLVSPFLKARAEGSSRDLASLMMASHCFLLAKLGYKSARGLQLNTCISSTTSLLSNGHC